MYTVLWISLHKITEYERQSEKRVLKAFQLLLRNRHLKIAQNDKK